MHHVSSIEVARHKEKVTEVKLEGFQSRFGKLIQERTDHKPQTQDKDKYIPPHIRDNKRSLEAQRMKEGKCRRCGERWDPRHRCHTEDNPKKLYTCEAEGNDESDTKESEGEEVEDPQNIASGSEGDNTPRISIVAMTGINQPQTLKLKGHIKNDNVTILIDTRSTHNFLDIRMEGNLSYLYIQFGT
jgi:hypothetical protein